MTENEKVKKWFATELSMREEESLDAIDCEDIMDICVKALEEIQQYRAIGTVEDIQLIFSLCKDLERIVKKYEAIGTLDEFKVLKEKNEPKKIVRFEDGDKCPICNHWVGFRYDYCDGCGQKLDWQ